MRHLNLVLCAATALAGCSYYEDMPVKWFDAQGASIVTSLERDFDIPLDGMSGREGVYHSGWAYRESGKWQTGSLIEIYGVADNQLQDAIISEVQNLLSRSNFSDAVISFKAESKYRTEGNLTTRLKSKELRKERLKAEPAP